jgi:hypothetical protein
MDAANAETFVEVETNGAEFGDRRLSERLAVIMAAAAASPSGSFPEMSGSDAALEGTYRFLGNARVKPELILEPHLRATTARVRAAERVIVSHDSTQCSFGPIPRGDLDRIGRGTTFGLDVHCALAVTGDESRVPLGVLAMTPFKRSFGSPRLPGGQNKGKSDNITHRWAAQVREIRARLGDATHVVHVMDREADDYALLAELTAQGERFVIRQATDRRLVKHLAEPKVRSLLVDSPLLCTREVALSVRRKPTKKKHASRAPLRKSRIAMLEIRATRVQVPKTTGSGSLGPDYLELNLVEAIEKEPPVGQEPVTWWLWTNEPITTDGEVLAVIDAYRARWSIEELFKALKTGCRFEDRQLESKHALLNALAIFLPVAWRLLLLRSLARHAPKAPGSLALTPLQMRALRGYMKKKRNSELPPDATAHEVMMAIAKIGGHISNNGQPGWIVLGRGLDRLLDIELGLVLALEM